MAAYTHEQLYYLGSEFFVYDGSTAGATPFAYSTECTLSLSANQIDTSNKQSGYWASALPGQISWNVSTSALYTNQNNYGAIFDKFVQRQPITVTFGLAKGMDSSGNFDASLNTDGERYVGTAYITSLELNAGNAEVASFSVEFTGEGQLKKTAASAS